MINRIDPDQQRSLLAGAAAVTAGMLVLSIFPALRLSMFAGGAARLASLFLGTPVLRLDHGWMLPAHPSPVLVTSACSGTDFWLMATALCAWQMGRKFKSVTVGAFLALICATPFSIAANSVRVVAVVQAHRWFIPLWPDAYGPFLHMLTGVAVFLPALIFLHVLLENCQRHCFSPAR